MPVNWSQVHLWRLSPGPPHRSPTAAPLRLAGHKKALDIHLDFEAATVDEILQRLTELRTRMEPPPIRQ